jgi:hypothetical protein
MRKLARPIFFGLVLLFSASLVAAKSAPVDVGYYTAQDKEFYLTEDQIFFIRPGLVAEIISFEIPADGQPEVTFTLKDPGGLALDIDGVTTPGEIEMRYYLTFVDDDGQKQIFDWGNRDQTGTLTDLGDGMFHYKFGNALPADYDMDATYTFALRARRDLREYDLDRYVVNEIYHFVPSGASEPKPRDIVTTETCNGRCHDPLAIHGGGYVEVQMCTQCHNPNYMALRGPETADSARFDTMVHRLHDEAHYPAPLNHCEACHTGGTPTEDFPMVASPNPVPVCDGSGRGVTTLSWDVPSRHQIRLDSPTGRIFSGALGEGSRTTGKWTRDGLEFFLVDPDTGAVVQQLGVDNTVFGCVGNAPYTSVGKAGELHTNWLVKPSRLVCSSCHSEHDINWETGEGHSEFNFPVDNDEVCASCHKPYSGTEFDRSIWGAHLDLLASSQFPGLIFEFVSITDTDPGDTPTVMFKLRTKNGPISPNDINRLRLTYYCTNDDFAIGDSFDDFYEEIDNNAVDMGKGVWAYTFMKPLDPLPAGTEDGHLAMDTYSCTAGVEGRDEVEIEIVGEDPEEENDTIESLIMPFAVTDAAAVPRRMVVDDANCETCHVNLTLHGNNRRNANYCLTCHRPERLDIATPAENVNFKWMIHKIHAGANLENGYTVVRSRGTFTFDDKHYPGDLANCSKCHVDYVIVSGRDEVRIPSYSLPLVAGMDVDLLDTLTPNQFWTPMGPISSACVSCHDGDDSLAHAFQQTTFFSESCTTCHGRGSAFDVVKVHAR